MMECLIKKNQTVLFQGDSVTDCYRTREEAQRGIPMGGGYPLIVAARFGEAYPELNVKFINRAVGGDAIDAMYKRWQRDCIDLKPDWVSIAIGANDVGKRTYPQYTPTGPMSADEFETVYRQLIEWTLRETGARLILMDPFYIPIKNERAFDEYLNVLRSDLVPKIEVIRKLANEYDALYIPLDGIFCAAAQTAPSSFWSKDGVHPSPAGHGLIASAWLKAVNA